MEISHSDIDKKVCVTKKKAGGSTKYGKYAEKTDNDTSAYKNEVAVCGAASNAGSSQNSHGATDAETFKNFVGATLKGDGSKNWPTSEFKVGEPSSTTNDNAEAELKT